MAQEKTFRRTKDRKAVSDHHWKAGYVFTSVDYNFNSKEGLCYAIDILSQTLHDADSIEEVVDAG